MLTRRFISLLMQTHRVEKLSGCQRVQQIAIDASVLDQIGFDRLAVGAFQCLPEDVKSQRIVRIQVDERAGDQGGHETMPVLTSVRRSPQQTVR